MMFASLIQYRLNPIFKDDFFGYWEQHRQLLISLGAIDYSVLHRETPIAYLSYTRWKNRGEFEKHILKKEGDIRFWQQKIEDCCNEVHVLYRMEIVKDIPSYGL